MPYTVTGESVGLAIGPVSETANDVHHALSKARRMYAEGLANILIADQEGHKIEGDELLDCITGTMTTYGQSASLDRQQIVLLTPGRGSGGNAILQLPAEPKTLRPSPKNA